MLIVVASKQKFALFVLVQAIATHLKAKLFCLCSAVAPFVRFFFSFGTENGYSVRIYVGNHAIENSALFALLSRVILERMELVLFSSLYGST